VTLRLHYHPLSSYCWKALIGLYETGADFEPVLVDLGDPAARAAFLALWPIGKFPVLEDTATGEVVPESSVILEWLDLNRPGPSRLVPADPQAAQGTRLWDRIFDLHVHDPMQRIVGDRIRPEGAKDPFGVEQARARLAVACDLVEGEAAKRTWFSGDGFGMADCAAFPALYYADRVQPLGAAHPATRAYLDRLTARPSVARVLKEAEPYFHMFPG
jgi:glutathione S-transferase